MLSNAVPVTVIFGLATALLGFGAAGAEENSIAIELNKLEPQDKQCRAYLVIQNKGSTDFSALKLDLVLFRPDGVIGRRFAVELAPLKGNKRTVRATFDTEATATQASQTFTANKTGKC